MLQTEVEVAIGHVRSCAACTTGSCERSGLSHTEEDEYLRPVQNVGRTVELETTMPAVCDIEWTVSTGRVLGTTSLDRDLPAARTERPVLIRECTLH
jgi:hypothetical protein